MLQPARGEGSIFPVLSLGGGEQSWKKSTRFNSAILLQAIGCSVPHLSNYWME